MGMFARHADVFHRGLTDQERANFGVFDITPAAHYFYEESSQEHWDIAEDFANFLSPFERAFYEMTPPEVSNSEGRLIRQPWRDLYRTFGYAVVRYEASKTEIATGKPRHGLLAQLLTMAGDDISNYDLSRAGFAGASPRWQQVSTEIRERLDGRLEYSGIVGDYLDENGKPITSARFSIIFLDAQRRALSVANRELFLALYEPKLYVLQFAISLLYCRNVVLTDRAEPMGPRPSAGDAASGPQVIYKVLDLHPIKRMFRDAEAAEGPAERESSDSATLKRRLHLCRGSFATYTEAKPLFGKLVGTFYRPAHQRGSKKRGEVKKTYRQHPPESGAG